MKLVVLIERLKTQHAEWINSFCLKKSLETERGIGIRVDINHIGLMPHSISPQLQFLMYPQDFFLLFFCTSLSRVDHNRSWKEPQIAFLSIKNFQRRKKVIRVNKKSFMKVCLLRGSEFCYWHLTRWVVGGGGGEISCSHQLPELFRSYPAIKFPLSPLSSA